jgi:putative membrane protein
MKPSRLVSPEEKLRLEAAIAAAERKGGGEIAVVVVGSCSAYAFVSWRLGVLFAVVVGLAAASFFDLLHSYLLASQAIALGAGHALGRLPVVRHHLVSDSVQDARVADAARRAFAEVGLARSPSRRGILIFVALLERRGVVLADAGIGLPAGPDDPSVAVVELVLAALREGRGAEGLVRAVARCGEILAERPAPAVAPPEIRDRVVLDP